MRELFHARLSGIIVLLILLLVTGCSTLNFGQFSASHTDGIPDKALFLFLALDDVKYSPNEPIKAVVHLQNLKEDTYSLPVLDAKTLKFYLINNDTKSVKTVEPVYSPKEDLARFENLKDNKYFRRQFLLTTCTETSGSYSIHAVYSTSAKEAIEGRPNVISAPYEFVVSGQAKYQRDHGILTGSDAVKIAAEKLGVPYKEKTYHLIINEAGYYDWWVTFTYINDKREEVKKAYLVNPYLCVVRREVIPYIETSTKDQNMDALKAKALKERAIINK